MSDSNLDFAIDDLDVTKEEREAALAKASALLAEVGLVAEWVKQPPEWFVAMYILDENFALIRHRIAFEPLVERPGYYKAVIPLLYHHMMIMGRMDDSLGYDDRWCYEDFPDALKGFQSWDGAKGTEPTGWHRHPKTGRRREIQKDGTWREHFDY
jgi:hypothetical protein